MALINLEITNLPMLIKPNSSCKNFYESLGVNVSNFPLTCIEMSIFRVF